MEPKFNWCIGYQTDNGYISVYAFGNEVHFGTMKQAQEMLEFISQRDSNPNNHYQIFKVEPLV